MLKKLSLNIIDNERIDKILSDSCEEMSRAKIQKIIKSDGVLVNGVICKDCAELFKGEIDITLNYQPVTLAQNTPTKMDLNIVFEDDDIIVINKPAGLVVHPGSGNQSGTLVNGLTYYSQSLSLINGCERPGIVHRLDKDTSGIIIVARNDTAHMYLAKQFEERSIVKKYIAFCNKVPILSCGTIEANIGRDNVNRIKMVIRPSGKPAITRYHVIKRFSNQASKIECELLTGRTHQIRVHMQHLKTPIIGDKLYTLRNNTNIDFIRNFPRQALHAYYVKFLHPILHREMEFTAPLSQDLIELEAQLETLNIK